MRKLFGRSDSSAVSGPAFGTHILHAENSVVVFPDREILLYGIYSRAGVDLVITTPDGHTYIVRGFFLLEHPPELSDGGATHIPGPLAAQFAGPIGHDQYAGTPAAN